MGGIGAEDDLAGGELPPQPEPTAGGHVFLGLLLGMLFHRPLGVLAGMILGGG